MLTQMHRWKSSGGDKPEPFWTERKLIIIMVVVAAVIIVLLKL